MSVKETVRLFMRHLLVATAVLMSDTVASAQTVEYYHLDAIGSVRVVTDAAGAVVERHDYLPFGDEFAAIDIPVLTVTGYYSAGATAALHYFTQHHQHDPNADHALLIGPFDSRSVERGASASVRDLAVDPVARINPSDLRYAWLEHALRGAQRPDLVQANVNYQLAGTNQSYVRLYAPCTDDPGSSIHHWDVVSTPHLLMEPSISSDPLHGLDLTLYQLLDIGWKLPPRSGRRTYNR
jgi:hypothetical protein